MSPDRRRSVRVLAVALIGASGAAAAGGSGGPSAPGDPVRGRQIYETRCFACHSIDAHRIGPAHRGLFERQAGTAPGYDYSAALRGSGLRWDEATLARWLADPEALVPGQRMGYRLEDPADRADVIAYLRMATRP